MKNSFILPIKDNSDKWIYPWNNCFNTTVKQLDQQTRDLYYLLWYFFPPYVEYKLEEGDDLGNKNQVRNMRKLPLHGYYITQTACFIQYDNNGNLIYNNSDENGRSSENNINTMLIAGGTYIISNAHAENDIDNTSASLRNNIYNYIIQQGGYGSFYVIKEIYKDPINNQYKVLFDYKSNAGEVYGYEPRFAWTLPTSRFITSSTIQITTPTNYYALGYSTNKNIGTLSSNRSFINWTTQGSPMHFTFFEDETNHKEEEIIYDEIIELNSLKPNNFRDYVIRCNSSEVDKLTYLKNTYIYII